MMMEINDYKEEPVVSASYSVQEENNITESENNRRILLLAALYPNVTKKALKRIKYESAVSGKMRNMCLSRDWYQWIKHQHFIGTKLLWDLEITQTNRPTLLIYFYLLVIITESLLLLVALFLIPALKGWATALALLIFLLDSLFFSCFLFTKVMKIHQRLKKITDGDTILAISNQCQRDMSYFETFILTIAAENVKDLNCLYRDMRSESPNRSGEGGFSDEEEEYECQFHKSNSDDDGDDDSCFASDEQWYRNPSSSDRLKGGLDEDRCNQSFYGSRLPVQSNISDTTIGSDIVKMHEMNPKEESSSQQTQQLDDLAQIVSEFGGEEEEEAEEEEGCDFIPQVILTIVHSEIDSDDVSSLSEVSHGNNQSISSSCYERPRERETTPSPCLVSGGVKLKCLSSPSQCHNTSDSSQCHDSEDEIKNDDEEVGEKDIERLHRTCDISLEWKKTAHCFDRGELNSPTSCKSVVDNTYPKLSAFFPTSFKLMPRSISF